MSQEHWTIPLVLARGKNKMELRIDFSADGVDHRGLTREFGQPEDGIPLAVR